MVSDVVGPNCLNGGPATLMVNKHHNRMIMTASGSLNPLSGVTRHHQPQGNHVNPPGHHPLPPTIQPHQTTGTSRLIYNRNNHMIIHPQTPPQHNKKHVIETNRILMMTGGQSPVNNGVIIMSSDGKKGGPPVITSHQEIIMNHQKTPNGQQQQTHKTIPDHSERDQFNSLKSHHADASSSASNHHHDGQHRLQQPQQQQQQHLIHRPSAASAGNPHVVAIRHHQRPSSSPVPLRSYSNMKLADGISRGSGGQFMGTQTTPHGVDDAHQGDHSDGEEESGDSDDDDGQEEDGIHEDDDEDQKQQQHDDDDGYPGAGGLFDESNVRRVNLTAAFHDHLSCTKLSASRLLLKTSPADGSRGRHHHHQEGRQRVEEEKKQNERLKDLLLIHLDLMQHQQEQLLKKDRQLQGLKQDREALCTRLQKMEKRISFLTRKLLSVADKQQQQQQQTPVSTTTSGGGEGSNHAIMSASVTWPKVNAHASSSSSAATPAAATPKSFVTDYFGPEESNALFLKLSGMSHGSPAAPVTKSNEKSSSPVRKKEVPDSLVVVPSPLVPSSSPSTGGAGDGQKGDLESQSQSSSSSSGCERTPPPAAPPAVPKKRSKTKEAKRVQKLRAPIGSPSRFRRKNSGSGSTSSEKSRGGLSCRGGGDYVAIQQTAAHPESEGNLGFLTVSQPYDVISVREPCCELLVPELDRSQNSCHQKKKVSSDVRSDPSCPPDPSPSSQQSTMNDGEPEVVGDEEIEVPSWRLQPTAACYSLEGTEVCRCIQQQQEHCCSCCC